MWSWRFYIKVKIHYFKALKGRSKYWCILPVHAINSLTKLPLSNRYTRYAVLTILFSLKSWNRQLWVLLSYSWVLIPLFFRQNCSKLGQSLPKAILNLSELRKAEILENTYPSHSSLVPKYPLSMPPDNNKNTKNSCFWVLWGPTCQYVAFLLVLNRSSWGLWFLKRCPWVYILPLHAKALSN